MGLGKTIKKIKESLIVKKINGTDFNNLELMSYDIKNFKTVEKFSQNDFYYNAYHMKKYCGYDTKKGAKITSKMFARLGQITGCIRGIMVLLLERRQKKISNAASR